MRYKEEKVLKKEVEPEFYTSAINTPARNYKVYYMKPSEKLFNFLAGFVIGGVLGYIFYGGIGKDAFNEPTTTTYIANAIVVILFGLLTGFVVLPVRRKQLLEKRKNALKLQFRQLLDNLSVAIGSGKNIPDAFISSCDDLKIIYSDDDYIIQELELIKTGLTNGVNIEEMLKDFGERSGITDIKSFASVFETCYRKGGNIKDIIRSTQQILVDKIEIEMDIETVITSSRTELNIMMVMPVILISLIKVSSPDFAGNFTSASGIVATTVALIMFVVAYFIGRKILKIKI